MGSGSNVQSKAEVIENSYLRDSYGVERLLKMVFEIAERSRYQFDSSATTLISDLEVVLDTNIFTPLERQSIALLYYAQLNYRQAAKLMGIKTHEVIDAVSEGIEKISAVLMGYRTKELPVYPRVKLTLSEWLSAIGDGRAAIYMVPDDVNTELLNWLAENGDDLAAETLRQREDGPPERKIKPYNVRDYPFYTDQQFKNMDRNLNVTFLPKEKLDKLALGRTVVGSRKVSFYEDEEGKFGPRVVKAKIYM